MSAQRSASHLKVHAGGALLSVLALGAVAALLGSVLGEARWVLAVLALAAAAVGFILGFVLKVGRWMKAPVPYRVPVTAGQQRSLEHVPHDHLGNPVTTADVVLRVVADVLLFRPLLRATRTAPYWGRGLSGFGGRWLWLFAALFHGSLAVILLRHLRFFIHPVPGFVTFLEGADSLTEMVLPKVHVTSVVFLVALGLLLARRLALPRLRYISLAADYFPLLLLGAIGSTGMLMRHVTGSDVIGLRDLARGVAVANVPESTPVDTWLLVHVSLVAVLLLYFPLSKLMHVPGALMSPTLTLANSNRQVRHLNVLNPVVPLLHYAEYEATFRERMIEAGLPVETAEAEHAPAREHAASEHAVPDQQAPDQQAEAK